MRKTNVEIKKFINDKIAENEEQWKANRGTNFGVPFQRLIRDYFVSQKTPLHIDYVECNENPNDTNPDVVVHYNNGETKGYEVKSCKNGALSGVSICNAPHLLNNSPTFLVNYDINADNVVYAKDVYETELFRLTSINQNGKYAGCLMSTRDTGKKIKGRNFNDFTQTSDEDDYTLEQLTAPSLIRKTILYYSASKLIDDEFQFTNEEINEALNTLRTRR